MLKNHLRSLVILNICVLAASFPFLNMAFHIDDTIFLYVARQILQHPFQPYSFSINWFGVSQNCYDFFSNPPGVSYYMAFIIHFFGESEKIIHTAYLLFSVLAATSMYYLCQRFVRYPFLATLLLVFSPLYMICAHTAMPDLCLLAFYLLSLVLFIHGYDHGHKTSLILSGLTASVSILSRYNGLNILILFVLYYLLHFDPKKKGAISVLLLPLALFFLWNYFTYKVYGQSHFLQQSHFQKYSLLHSSSTIFKYGLPNLTYLGAAAILPPLFLIPYASKERGNKFLFYALAVYAFFVATLLGRELPYDRLNTLLIFIFLFCPLYFTALSIKRAGVMLLNKTRDRDSLFLIFWFLSIILMHLSGVHAAAKYMLPAVPPLILLILRETFWAKLKTATRNGVFSGLVLLTASAGFLTAAADYKLADAYRDMARKSDSYLKSSPAHQTWFLGHWGFQYYMEKAGAKAFDVLESKPQAGDFLVASSLAWPQEISGEWRQRINLLETIRYEWTVPVRVMHNGPQKRANFYSFYVYPASYGVLPFSFSRLPLEEFKIYKFGNKNDKT